MRTKYLLILLLLLLILPVSAEPLVKVEIFNNTYYESLTVLKPENWIKMTGGSDVPIPTMKFVYNGINSTQYTKGDKTVRITTNEIQRYEDYVVNYPFTKHPIYYEGDNVTAEIDGTKDIANETAYVYLVKTYPTQLKDALASAVSFWNISQSLRIISVKNPLSSANLFKGLITIPGSMVTPPPHQEN